MDGARSGGFGSITIRHQIELCFCQKPWDSETIILINDFEVVIVRKQFSQKLQELILPDIADSKELALFFVAHPERFDSAE